MDKGKRLAKNKVYYFLREAIFSRKLAPGTQLIESVIAENLNVSRTPIRSAFHMLQNEGMVTLVENRGAFVVQPTAEEITNVFSLRAELEIISIDYGIKNITASDYDAMYEIIKQEKKFYTEGDFLSYIECNKKFHTIYAVKSKNKMLIEFLDRLFDSIGVILVLYDTWYSGTDPNSPKGHEELLLLLKSGAIDELKRHLRKHIVFTRDHVEKNIINYVPLRQIF